MASFIAVACFGEGPAARSRDAVVSFCLVDETFKVRLLDERQIDAAHTAANGGGQTFPAVA